MAAQDYYAVVQQLYVSYFGRPADYYGLQNFAARLDAIHAPTDFIELNAAIQKAAPTSALGSVVNSFNSSPEAIALYGTDNSQIGISKFVAAVYQNVLNREADVEGLTFWVNEILAGRLTKANAAAAITEGALSNTSAQGLLDAKTVENKVTVATNFTTAIDTTSEINGYAGDAAAKTARDMLALVNSSTDAAAFQSTVESTLFQVVNGQIPSQTFTLTTGIDKAVGGAGSDTINIIAKNSAGSQFADFVSALDVVDGGAGVDTLQIASSDATTLAMPAGFSPKNIEIVSISSTSQVGASAAARFDLSDSSITDVTVVSGGAVNLKANGSSNVAVTTTGTNAIDLSGGKVVTLNAATGTTSVVGAALTNVTVNGGGAATVDNTSAGGTSAGGSTLTSVTLAGIAGATAAVKGKALTTVNLEDQTSALAVTVTNSTAAHTLNVSTDGVGYTAAGAAVVVSVTDANATKVAITSKGDDNIALNAAAATSVTIGGDGAIAIDMQSGTSTLVTSIDGSANTGGITLTDVVAGAVTITTGSGDDDITTSQTAKATLTTGAGDDIVRVATALAAGTTVTLGDGDDLLLAAGGSVAASTASATTVIDGGAGTDVLGVSLINATNVGVFKNFESLDLAAMANDLDIELLGVNNTITNLIITDDTATAGKTLKNVATGATLTVLDTGAVANGAIIDVKGAAAASADTFTIKFDAEAAASATTSAVKLTIANVETINVVAGGGKNISDALTLTAANAKTVVVTGASDIDLSTSTLAAATSVDASAATGSVTVDLADLKSSGATVKLGAGDDIVKVIASGSAEATLDSIVGFDLATAAEVTAADGGWDLLNMDITGDGNTTDEALVAANVASFITNGVLTLDATVTDLTTAIALANSKASVAGSVAVFQYGADSYVFVQGATDQVVKLTGVTGITGVVETAAGDSFYLTHA